MIYVDMDGVLVDFIGGKEDMGCTEDFDNLFWSEVKSKGSAWWENLNEIENGDLAHWLKGIEAKWTILSVYPATGSLDAMYGKRLWLQKHLGQQVAMRAVICHRNSKKDFAGEAQILIDDYEVNIKQWVKAGGIGILHESASQTIDQLRGILERIS